MSTDLKEATFNVKNRKTIPLPSVSLYPADAEMLDKVITYLGCSKSEAIRTAIRLMATQLPLPR